MVTDHWWEMPWGEERGQDSAPPHPDQHPSHHGHHSPGLCSKFYKGKKQKFEEIRAHTACFGEQQQPPSVCSVPGT